MIRRRVVAHGRVQGVFFRDSTQKEARSTGVAGWVANRSDGAVEAVFEGDETAVQRMVEFVKSGPGRADVEDLEILDEEPGGIEGFEVR